MKKLLYSLSGVILLLLLSMALLSCHTQYVPIETVKTEYYHHTDSVKQVDSVYKEKETIIKELDSATMASYGIKLEGMQKAWLVQTRELERRLRELQEQRADTVINIDTVRVPYPVEKKLSGWQQFKVDFGEMILGLFFITVFVFVMWLILKRKI